MSKFSGKKKRKGETGNKVDADNVDKSNNEDKSIEAEEVNERSKSRKQIKKSPKKNKNASDKSIEAEEVNERSKSSRKQRKKSLKKNKNEIGSGQSETQGNIEIENLTVLKEAEKGTDVRADKVEKSSKKRKKKDKKAKILLEERKETEPIYQISSVDEDSSKGMQKWIMEYHQSRPGLKILQERIDEFIVDHEAREEQERKEREAQAAEGGWTVVVHHKGRKKTTESETGITVGSVAQAAVLNKMDKKKNKDVGVDFYRFQKREAHRNEVMMLQSKFEEDKKRIQQLRAARKFRPY